MKISLSVPGYKPVEVNLESVITLGAVIPRGWAEHMTPDTLGCPADSPVGKRIMTMVECAAALHGLLDEEDQMADLRELVASQATVWYHG